MRLSVGRLVLATAFALGASAGPALAATATSPDHLAISASTTTVSGKPVTVNAVLTDGSGQPVQGALIRLVTKVTFMGASHDEIVDEATTGTDGKAVLTFAPTVAGPATVTARYGATGSTPVEASLAFNVQVPIVAYHPTPVGLQAPWARSYFILLPVLVVWFVYLLVIAQASKIRRAGHRSPVS